MCYIGLLNPKDNIWLIAYSAAAIAFFSASQDVVLDAYRRELLPDEELGLGNSMSMVTGLLDSFPAALPFILAPLKLARHLLVVASFMLVGIVMTLLIKETSKSSDAAF